MKCRICHHNAKEIVDFGLMPIANGFVKDPQEKEYKYPLVVYFCPVCCMVQLAKQPAPEKMFHDHYQFISSTSKAMAIHFEEEAKHILRIIARRPNPLVMEIGSNDGIMLRHLVSAGVRHVGVEPAGNVAAMAEKNGVTVWNGFFSNKTAKELKKKYGKVDVFCGSNVTCHIATLRDVARGVHDILQDDGVWFFEDPYMYDIAKLGSFDQIYDEHVYFFSGVSVQNFAQLHGFSLVDMRHQAVHGGSMRYYLKKGKHQQSSRVEMYIRKERQANLHVLAGYRLFKKQVEKIADDLRGTLIRLKKSGKKIAGYGATSKSTTLLTFAKIGPEHIEYISDNTPTKIGLFTPGTHIPVKSHDVFVKDPPDYMVLLAWNHKKEILKKETEYRAGGGKFITFFPKVRII